MSRFLARGLAVALLVAACAGARTLSFAVITGGSMAPTLVPGDLCVVFKTARVAADDLMLFETADREQMVVHRIVSVGEGGIRTKGDANGTVDRDTVSEERIRGRVVQVIGFGRLLAWLDSASSGDTLRSQSHSRR